MNTLDLILIVAMIVYAVSGYHQGFLVGAATTSGLLLGGLLGIKLTPMFLDRFDQTVSVSVMALLIVLGFAFVGQIIGSLLGSKLRTRLTWRPVRVVDALGGAALSVVAMLLIAWVLGVAASGAPMAAVNRQVRGSAVLGAVDGVLPGDANRWLSAFSDLVDSSTFPRYLEPFATERIKEVPRPVKGILSRPGVEAARSSVVKIIGNAPACERGLEGSGFVYASGRVMTNAHVVAGVSDPVVEAGGSEYDADIVYYDSDTDVAVLHVDGLTAPALHFASEAMQSEDSAAVLGYPNNGPYDARPARIRAQQALRSPNIYGDGTVLRDTYSLYGLVRPGNSGGPLVDAGGDVTGVVFAASLTDANTGYALTADQVSEAAAAGLKTDRPLTTADCAE